MSVSGVGRIAIKKLIDHYKDVEMIFEESPGELSRICGLSINKVKEIAGLSKASDSFEKRELDAVLEKGYTLYFYGDKTYPKLLSEIPDPPIVLYSKGRIKPTDFNSVAVVGTRKASQYGKSVAKIISKELAVNNLTVVSGCAAGIDTQAHEGAIEGGGRTIAVLGSGLDQKYPVCNSSLMESIADNGALVSELPVNTRPAPYNFPQRNRLISGLSLSVVIVEAPSKSGALITAYHAAEQGRSVCSVPGSIFSSKSRGSNDLLKQGAVLVSGIDDIIEDLKSLIDMSLIKKRDKEFINENISEKGKNILKILCREPIHIDKIQVKTGLEMNILAKELTNLELIGRINQIGGKRYVKNG